ncbi:GNAT family N-acetyltransferase [Tissierella sp.]|uniref:GNAT family N-acetyltransferase n=1 Tax=Tissierella sp. TaxID=41274 RepID=UPI0030439FF4
MKQEAENRYTYFIDGETVGHGWLEGNEIGSISVRIDMQGKGIGRKFAKYLCNELYNRGNKARYLYESLGFEELYVSEFARKYLRE